MIHQDDNGNQFYVSLDEAKSDGLFPVKVISLLGFFQLRGRTSVTIKTNFEPIPNLRYAVYAKAEEKYYVKEYRKYNLDTLFFYRPSLTFGGDDLAVENLRRYTDDGTVFLMLTPEQVATTTAMLERIWNAHFADKGKMPYKSYLELAETTIRYEDYKEYSKGLTGFKTICNQFELQIKEIWDNAYKSKR